MKVSIDLERLRKAITFQFLELIELDNADTPIAFTELSVPPEVTLPKTTLNGILSRLVCMRFARTPVNSVVAILKDELPRGCEFDILAIAIEGKRVPLVGLFYVPSLPAAEANRDEITAAIEVSDFI